MKLIKTKTKLYTKLVDQLNEESNSSFYEDIHFVKFFVGKKNGKRGVTFSCGKQHEIDSLRCAVERSKSFFCNF